MTTEVQIIPASNGIDPITVFWQDYEPGRGQITLYCYGSAWTSYWGGMGNKTIKQFVADGDTSYVVNKLLPNERDWMKVGGRKAMELYLFRIVANVKLELKLEIPQPKSDAQQGEKP